MKWFNTSKAVVLLIWCAVMISAMPAADGAQIEEWTVYNTANSGLPYNGATMLAFDQKGAVWIGTGRWFALAGGGLVKFDGESWVVYNTANSPLPNNDHFGLAVDPQGNVWAGTEGGLAKFDGTNWTVYNTSNSGLRDNRVAPPVFDDQGHFWAGTWGGGLVEFDGVNWMVYNTANSGLPNNTPFATAFDKQKNLWIGTVGGGLVKFDGTNWTVFNTANSPLPNNTVYYIDFDSQENLWIATDGGGLAKFDGMNWTVYNISNSGLPSNRIWPIKVDTYDNVWIGTYDKGLAMFNGKDWTVYNTSNSELPDNTINDLAIDIHGDIWIATQSGGIAVYHPEEPAPIIDFNGDGIVNAADMRIMIDHWLTNDPLCDIAPPPSGDGIVDVQDMILLSEHLFEQVYDPTLVAHWPLDEAQGVMAYNDVADRDGTLNNGPVWQPDGGMVAGALQFDGIDDYVSTDPVLNPADGVFSVIAWVQGGAPGQVVISREIGANWLMLDAEGKLTTELQDSGRNAAGPLLSETNITDGNWHRIGLVWDGSYRHLHVDGAEVAGDDAPLTSLKGSGGGLRLGAGSTLAPGTFFSGLIDDVRIYNRAVSP